MYVMFWFEQNAPEKLIEDIGVGNVLVETDIPHPTCLYPEPARALRRGAGRPRPDASVSRVLQDNAAELCRPISRARQ